MELELSQLLRRYFERTGESYAKVAARSWLDPAYVFRLVNGQKRRPSRDTLIKLGVGMGLSIPELDELLMAGGYAPLVRFQYPRKGRK